MRQGALTTLKLTTKSFPARQSVGNHHRNFSRRISGRHAIRRVQSQGPRLILFKAQRNAYGAIQQRSIWSRVFQALSPPTLSFNPRLVFHLRLIQQAALGGRDGARKTLHFDASAFLKRRGAAPPPFVSKKSTLQAYANFWSQSFHIQLIKATLGSAQAFFQFFAEFWQKLLVRPRLLFSPTDLSKDFKSKRWLTSALSLRQWAFGMKNPLGLLAVEQPVRSSMSAVPFSLKNDQKILQSSHGKNAEVTETVKPMNRRIKLANQVVEPYAAASGFVGTLVKGKFIRLHRGPVLSSSGQSVISKTPLDQAQSRETQKILDYAHPFAFPPAMTLVKLKIPETENLKTDRAIQNETTTMRPASGIPSISNNFVPAPQIDINHLTDRVYAEMERKIRNERIRRGL